jgi:cytochrome c oxidase assembly factor CtaG
VGYIAVVYFSSMGMANILMWSGTVLYPVYADGEHARGIAPLTDQSLAGAVLMIQGGVVMLGVFLWVLIQWAAQDTERQELIDLAERLNVPLSEQRAARAAAAGRGSELRERLEREANRRGTGGPQPVAR